MQHHSPLANIPRDTNVHSAFTNGTFSKFSFTHTINETSLALLFQQFSAFNYGVVERPPLRFLKSQDLTKDLNNQKAYKSYNKLVNLSRAKKCMNHLFEIRQRLKYINNADQLAHFTYED